MTVAGTAPADVTDRITPFHWSGYTEGMNRTLAALLFAAILAPVVAAHTLPKSQFDRTIEVRIDPAGVNVRYSLMMAEESMTFDGYTFLTPADIEKIKSKPRESFLSWYAEAKGERIAKSFFCTLNGRDLKFRLMKVDVGEVDHNKRFDFRFRAEWPVPFNAPTYRMRSGTLDASWSLHSGFAYDFQFADDTCQRRPVMVQL